MRKALGSIIAVSLLAGCATLPIESLTLGSPEPSALKSEKIVAGGPNDLMIVRHIKLEGSQQQIGVALAELAKRNHNVKPATGDPATIKKQATWLKANWPEQYERSEGVALSYGLIPGKNLDPQSLNYNVDLRPGCSVVFYPGSSVQDGHSILSRNYDFPTGTYGQIIGQTAADGARSMTGDPYVIEMHSTKGYASLFIGCYDILAGCIDGINEKGLAVALLADDATQNRSKLEPFGLSEIRLTRFLLDRCANAKEARKALESAPVYYSMIPCHYLVCDASGDSFVFEQETDGSKKYIVDGKGKPQIVTNHMLARFGDDPKQTGNSFDRYRRLKSEIASRGSAISREDAETINACVRVPDSVEGAATLWHSVYDLKDRKLSVSFYLGKDGSKTKRTPYLEFSLK